jgi:hypothetical protein
LLSRSPCGAAGSWISALMTTILSRPGPKHQELL